MLDFLVLDEVIKFKDKNDVLFVVVLLADDDVIDDVADIFEVELDLVGVDVFAIAGDDDVLDAAFHIVRAGLVFFDDVACPVIAIFENSRFANAADDFFHVNGGSLHQKLTLSIHGSLLPKLRGAAPIQRAIMEGDKETGITLMEMVAAMDAGCMYDKAVVAIDPVDTYTTLCGKMATAASDLIAKDLLAYANGQLKGEEQNEKEVTIANKIKPEDEKIPLFLSCQSTIDYIRGISEEPGGYFLLEDKKLKVYHAKIHDNQVIRAVGEIVPDRKHFLVQLYDGSIELEIVQPEGKKKMNGNDFLSGAHLGDHVLLK